MSLWGKKKHTAACLPPVTVRFQIFSSQMFNNSFTYIGGYLTYDRQTVCSSSEWRLGAPLTVKPIRESSPKHRSLAHHFTSLFDSCLPGEVSMCMFSMRTPFRNDKLVNTNVMYCKWVSMYMCVCLSCCSIVVLWLIKKSLIALFRRL